MRGVGVLAILFVLQLWLGIYQPGEPDEWPWTFMFLASLLFVFVIEAAGRDLGLDALLRRKSPAVRDDRGLIGRILQIVS